MKQKALTIKDDYRLSYWGRQSYLTFKVLIYGIFGLVLLSKDLYTQSLTKKGGICFRTDDDQPISQYLEYASLFNNYNKKFTFAINLGMDPITPDYINSLRQIQAAGHEMMDHTPWHNTFWFHTPLSTDIYINHPGVHNIYGENIVELKHEAVDINNALRTGYLNINGDIISSPDGIFGNFATKDCYLYFPELDQLLYIEQNNWLDENTVKVEDFWGHAVDLGSYQNIQFYNFDYFGIHLTIDALRALAEESLRLANYYNLERPYTWIQPGGYFPQVYRNELKQACGDALGYKSAGVFADPSLKVFNEYNPNNDKQFGMNFGDFKDNTWELEDCKALIADRIAKHHVVFGENHFDWGAVLLGGWPGFLQRTEALIQWCIANDIPIKTYSEWADILYNQTPNPSENIFPPLNVDLDANNIPDGYNNSDDGILSKSDGYPSDNDYSYTIKKVGNICSISKLAGLEKGNNNFEIWIKGSRYSTNYIEVTFKVGLQDKVYRFSNRTSYWKKYDLSMSVNGNTSLLNIPETESQIDVTIKCSNYSGGTVKISGMNLYKPSSGSNYLNINPTYANVSSEAGSVGFDIFSSSSWTATDNANWLTVSPSSGYKNGTLTATYSANMSFDERMAVITVNGSGVIRTVTVTQAPTKQLEVSHTNLSLPNTGGDTSIIISSNLNWVVNDSVNWLEIVPPSGFGDDTLSLVYLPNQTILERTAVITITGSGLSRMITVVQEAGTISTDCPSSLMSWWKLDETLGSVFVDDYNGYNGQTGTNSPTPATGIVGGGQSFDGVNDAINVISTTPFNFNVNSSFSIEFWLKHPASLSENEVIIGRDDPSSNLQWWVGIDGTGKAIFYLKSRTGERFSTTGISSLIDTNWHHIAAVRDADLNQIRIYVNGELEGTTAATYTSGFDSSAALINIGWLNITGGYYFEGLLDEVAIHRDKLSLNDIQNHYYTGLSGIGYCDSKIFVSAKIFLEGPYDKINNRMNTGIINYLPLISPYDENPRNVISIPPDVVDWVLVELKSNISGNALISKSIFLNKNGYLVADDGITQNISLAVPQGNYYILLKHRNHLAIMSSSAQSYSPVPPAVYDFTTAMNMAFTTGPAPMADLGGGKFGMFAGDANRDGTINATDYNIYWLPQNGTPYNYLSRTSDFNLDATINATDYNKFWLINNGRATQVQ